MSSPRTARLWLALRPLNLPLQVLSPAEKQAVCILEKQRVVCANDAALNSGVTLGMDVTTARLLSDCRTLTREPQLEQQLLNQLAERLYAFTPYIEIYHCQTVPQVGLFLEISRCLKLFGGLLPLCEKIFAAMGEMPFAYGLAHSAQAAWLLSYHHYPLTGDENKTLFLQRLNQMDIKTLYDYPEAVDALKKTGFVTLADVARQIETQSISSIKKRFGEDFARYIGDLFGIDLGFQQNNLFDRPLNVYQPQEFFFDAVQFDYPVSQLDQLYSTLETMLEKLVGFLRKRQLTCQQIEWKLFDIYHNSEGVKIHCDKSQSQWRLLYELTLIQLEHRPLPFAVDAIELTCRNTQTVQNQNQKLDFNGKRNKAFGSQSLAIVEAKLKARLGEQAVFKVSYKDTHIPEQSNITIAAFTSANRQLPPTLHHNPRPSWLFDTPFAIEHRQQTLRWRGDLQLLAGPERIEGHWWETAIARDYYVAQREDGLRLWVFCDLAGRRWFVQGIFGG